MRAPQAEACVWVSACVSLTVCAPSSLIQPPRWLSKLKRKIFLCLSLSLKNNKKTGLVMHCRQISLCFPCLGPLSAPSLKCCNNNKKRELYAVRIVSNLCLTAFSLFCCHRHITQQVPVPLSSASLLAPLLSFLNHAPLPIPPRGFPLLPSPFLHSPSPSLSPVAVHT